MSGFGEEPLTTPVVVSRTSDQCRPIRLDIRASEKLIRIEYESGTGTGSNFAAHMKGNITVQNQTNPDGTPGVQDWDDFMGGTEIVAWCKAQPAGTSNAKVFKKIADFLLGKAGVT